MKMLKIKIICFAVLTCTISCSDGGGSSDTPGPTTNIVTPTEAEVTAAIESGDYTSWFGDSTVQSAQTGSPHGKVRTFLNTELKASVDAGLTQHTVGSISVKELYNNEGTTLTGYAYSQKISEGTAADTWLWYEDLSPSSSSVDYFGVGIATCSGCHEDGNDYLRIQL